MLWRRLAPRWFSILIGIDLVSGVLQILPYRFGLHAHSRLIWIGGIVLAAPVGYMALVEAAEMERGPLQFWHVRILSLWLTGLLCIVSLQTQRDLILALNPLLIIFESMCFVCWLAVFSRV